jgi:hypothetical protein
MKRTLLAMAAMVGALGLAGTATAAPIFQQTFGGATFTVTQNSPTVITFDIMGANALNNNNNAGWAGAEALDAFAFNGNIISGTPTDVTAASPLTDVTFGGLNASGCDGKGFSSGICFDLDPPPAVAPDMSFTITLTGATWNLSNTNVPDLKIDWSSTTTDNDVAGTADVDTHLGSLFSADIPAGAVPEPATWAMMLLGVGAIGAAMRFSRRNATSLATA